MAQPLFSDLLRHIRRTAVASQVAGLEDSQLLERFISQHDEAAFTLLLRRHGPMVLGVCQRLLPNPHDCEDAFQATFLVLLRKARSLRKRELLANWLYGVARRTALKARSQSVRRGGHTTTELIDVPAAIDTAAEAARRDLRSVLDEELNRLRAKYRVPVILCYLEGKTFAEAAVQLGWPAGTVSGRLARARDLLKKRLERRDITLEAGWEALMLQPAAPTQVSTVLISNTLRSATSLVAGTSAGAAAISSPVAVLTEGVLKAMFLTKIKILVAVVGIGLTITGSGVLVSAKMTGQFPRDEKGRSATAIPLDAREKNLSAQNELPGETPAKRPSPFDDKAEKAAFYQTANTSTPLPGLTEEQAKAILDKTNWGKHEKLRSLLESLFEAANVEAHSRWLQFNAGQGTLDFLFGSSTRLMEAERLVRGAIADSRSGYGRKKDRVATLEHHLKRMQEIEKVNQARFDAGRIALGDLAQSRFFRIQAEVWLYEENANPSN
jgi:RNA polymerase sigma factor (sigma-70 family)